MYQLLEIEQVHNMLLLHTDVVRVVRIGNQLLRRCPTHQKISQKWDTRGYPTDGHKAARLHVYLHAHTNHS